MTTAKYRDAWDACTVCGGRGGWWCSPATASTNPDVPAWTRCRRCQGQGREPSALVRAVLRWGTTAGEPRVRR